uniref:Uncharacterized protein n=1 Tax=Oryza punctata TaxID=4537 RepID=A0A0E0MJZ7_ORYPU
MEWRKGAWLPLATMSFGSGMPLLLLQAGDYESTTTEGKVAELQMGAGAAAVAIWPVFVAIGSHDSCSLNMIQPKQSRAAIKAQPKQERRRKREKLPVSGEEVVGEREGGECDVVAVFSGGGRPWAWRRAQGRRFVVLAAIPAVVGEASMESFTCSGDACHSPVVETAKTSQPNLVTKTGFLNQQATIYNTDVQSPNSEMDAGLSNHAMEEVGSIPA